MMHRVASRVLVVFATLMVAHASLSVMTTIDTDEAAAKLLSTIEGLGGTNVQQRKIHAYYWYPPSHSTCCALLMTAAVAPL